MKKKYLLACMALAAMASCTNVELNEKALSGGDDGNTENPWGEGEIVLSSPRVTLTPGGAQTRTPFEGTINPGNPLLARVAATQQHGYYEQLYVDGQMNFTNSHSVTSFQPGFEGSKYYPASGSIYIFDLYPTASTGCGPCGSDGYEVSSAWSLDSYFENWQFTFGGSDDIMVAPEVQATKQSTGELVPSLTFHHMLTRLNISFKATNPDVPARWGNITGISLVSVQGNQPNSRICVNLGRAQLRPEFDSPVSNFKCYKATGSGSSIMYTDEVYSDQKYGLTTTSTLQAYTLMAPVSIGVGDKLVLRILMDGDGSDNPTGKREVEVTLKNAEGGDFTGDTMGKSFDILLSFSATEINASAEVIDWVEGGDTETSVD